MKAEIKVIEHRGEYQSQIILNGQSHIVFMLYGSHEAALKAGQDRARDIVEAITELFKEGAE